MLDHLLLRFIFVGLSFHNRLVVLEVFLEHSVGLFGRLLVFLLEVLQVLRLDRFVLLT